MNVVHVFPYPARVSGGHSNAIRSFIASQLAKGINAVAIAPKPEKPLPDSELGFRLVEVASLWSLRWKEVAGFLDLKRAETLLHFHSVNRRFAGLQGDLGQNGLPYVLTSHGQLSYRSTSHWLRKFVYLHLVDQGPRNAAGLHLLTRSAENRLRFLLPGYRGVTVVQGNLVGAPSPAPRGSATDFGIPEGAFVLLFLGRLDVRVKGLDLVMEAFSKLPRDRFRLILAGPDWKGGKARLERLANQLACGDRVHFIGGVYGDRKWALLRCADAFVSPSRWDAFSVAHVEAMACGLPLVTSTTIAMAPELRLADAALVVKPAPGPLAEAVLLLERDSALRQALGARGRAWTEVNCSADGAGDRFLRFYQAILDRQRGDQG